MSRYLTAGETAVTLVGPDGMRVELKAEAVHFTQSVDGGWLPPSTGVPARCELRLLSWEPAALYGPSPLPALKKLTDENDRLKAELARLQGDNEELQDIVARSLADSAEVVRLGADQERKRMREAAARQRAAWLERLHASPGATSLRCYLNCLDDLELTLLTGWTR